MKSTSCLSCGKDLNEGVGEAGMVSGMELDIPGVLPSKHAYYLSSILLLIFA